MPNLLPAIRCLCGNKVGKLHNEPEDDSEEGCREAERINPFSAALGGQPRCSPPQCSLGLGAFLIALISRCLSGLLPVKQ